MAGWDRSSWVESANEVTCGFPLQSLPYCVFAGADEQARIGVGIGHFVLDLRECSRSGVFECLSVALQEACEAPMLNALISCGPAAHAAMRKQLLDVLDVDSDKATRDRIR